MIRIVRYPFFFNFLFFFWAGAGQEIFGSLNLFQGKVIALPGSVRVMFNVIYVCFMLQNRELIMQCKCTGEIFFKKLHCFVIETGILHISADPVTVFR